MILLDTDHLSVVLDRRRRGHSALTARLKTAPESPVIPIVCAEEQCKGWLAKIRHTRNVHEQTLHYEHLKILFDFFRAWKICSFDTAAADAFTQFRKQKIRIGSQDLKIAAIVLNHDALLLSANLRDFRQVPGLRVENWLEP